MQLISFLENFFNSWYHMEKNKGKGKKEKKNAWIVRNIDSLWLIASCSAINI